MQDQMLPALHSLETFVHPEVHGRKSSISQIPIGNTQKTSYLARKLAILKSPIDEKEITACSWPSYKSIPASLPLQSTAWKRSSQMAKLLNHCDNWSCRPSKRKAGLPLDNAHHFSMIHTNILQQNSSSYQAE